MNKYWRVEIDTVGVEYTKHHSTLESALKMASVLRKLFKRRKVEVWQHTARTKRLVG